METSRLELTWALLPHSIKVTVAGAGGGSCPGVSSGEESTCSVGNVGLMPGSGRSPGEGLPTPGFLPGEPHGQSSLAG